MTLSRSARFGLVLLGVSSVLDLLTPLLTDGKHPPMAVALVAAIVGLVSLALVVSVWRGATRAVPWLVVLRAATLTAVPGILRPDHSGADKVEAAVIVLTAAVGVALVLRDRRSHVAVGAR